MENISIEKEKQYLPLRGIHINRKTETSRNIPFRGCTPNNENPQQSFRLEEAVRSREEAGVFVFPLQIPKKHLILSSGSSVPNDGN
jgi:hypothetical protein